MFTNQKMVDTEGLKEDVKEVVENKIDYKVNEFLRSLDTGLEVQFENFQQYGNLLMDIHELINGRLEYGLKYSKKQ